MTGALKGLRIIEIAGIGPGPFAGMMLADHGAEVILVERPGGHPLKASEARKTDILLRSRRSIAVDLKAPGAAGVIKALVRDADGLIEGFRPGVMERLGLGPDDLMAINPRLTYGRMTGWGQVGPMAAQAGHDINYIAIAGVLHAIGPGGGKPVPPMNLVGDFGGGGMLLAFGMLASILAAQRTGQGQVVDCAMTDGSALLMTMIWGFRAQGLWQDRPGANMLDGGSHFYDTYETRDGKAMAVGSVEPAFYESLLRVTGVSSDVAFDAQMDNAAWPGLKARLTEVFRTRTRAEWVKRFDGADCCVTPVLSMQEALEHPQNRLRETFIEVDGVAQPAPAPRLSHNPASKPRAPGPIGADTGDLLAEVGFDAAAIDHLRAQDVLG